MNKQKYFELREELKELAKKIRPIKDEYDQSQHDYSLLKNDVVDFRNKYNQARSKVESCRSAKHYAKYEYRHKHIIYCLARGKTMEQIEPKTREGNIPDSSFLSVLKQEYGFDEINPMILEDNLAAIQG